MKLNNKNKEDINDMSREDRRYQDNKSEGSKHIRAAPYKRDRRKLRPEDYLIDTEEDNDYE